MVERSVPIFKRFFDGIWRETSQNLLDHNSLNGAATIDFVFPSVGDLTEQFLETAFRPMVTGFVNGAMEEITLFEELRKTEKRTTAQLVLELLGLDDIGDWFSFEVPQWLLDVALPTIQSVFDMPYWLGVIQHEREAIQKLIEVGITDGLSIREIAKRMMSQLGNGYTKSRAMMIANTEISAAMNSGHRAGIEHLAEEVPELEIGSEWLSIHMQTTRPDHAAAEGQVARPGGKFILGGEECEYPGDPNLSAGQRIHCHCTLLSTFIVDELGIGTEAPVEVDENIDG